MMMFLTRLGEESRMVVTGDITQIDLPRSKAERPARSAPHPRRHRRHRLPHLQRQPMSSATRSSQQIIAAYDAYRNPIAGAAGEKT
jgi:phosphate starvation-inducible PhoH-like protein